MARALIIGCGAIGRGFMPWLLGRFEIDFFDADKKLFDGIAKQGGFRSFMSDGGNLQERWVNPHRLMNRLEQGEVSGYDHLFIFFWPRNVG